MLGSENILKREEEFLKLNAEIELRTRDLMTEMDKIKELHSDNCPLFGNWEKSEPPTSGCIFTETQGNGSSLPDFSTEQDFLQGKHFCGVRAEDSECKKSLFPVGPGNVQSSKVELHPSKQEKLGESLMKSGKITTSSVCTQETEAELFLGITRHKSDMKHKQEKMKTEVIPDTLKGVSHDGITRFLTAKVRLLNEQVEIMQKDEKKHIEKIKELQLHKDKSTEEQNKLIQQANMARSLLIKYERQANDVIAQLQTAQAENNHLKKELDVLKKEMRQNSKAHSTNEVKLNRTLEEIEKLKFALQFAKQEERELKEMHQKKMENLSTTVKKLDRQRVELLNGFKKQLLIIDNLKRQKGLIEAGKLVRCAEEDFINFLECNPPKGGAKVSTNKCIKS